MKQMKITVITSVAVLAIVVGVAISDAQLVTAGQFDWLEWWARFSLDVVVGCVFIMAAGVCDMVRLAMRVWRRRQG